jgi:hypothetical protein
LPAQPGRVQQLAERAVFKQAGVRIVEELLTRKARFAAA